MVENLPLKRHQFAGLTIEGWSRAAVQSYWHIPELKLGFDLGACPWSFTGTRTIFVTHAHLDHLASLPVYVARRRMMKMEPPVIYMPEDAVEPCQRLLRVWQHMDRGRMVCELKGVKPGDEIELSREHIVQVFQTKHTVTSVGYQVFERRRKLKPELATLNQDQIRELRLAGEEVTHELRMPIVCYTGDTAPPGLDDNPICFESRVLITELTFFRPDHKREKIHKFGHMHLDDFIERAEQFKNELIILAHFSTRYPEATLEKSITRRLPESLKDRILLWI